MYICFVVKDGICYNLLMLVIYGCYFLKILCNNYCVFVFFIWRIMNKDVKWKVMLMGYFFYFLVKFEIVFYLLVDKYDYYLYDKLFDSFFLVFFFYYNFV